MRSDHGAMFPKDVLVVPRKYAIIGIMRFRTTALAVALVFGSGAVATVHAADAKKVAKQRNKQLKKLNKQRAKNSNAAQYKRPKTKPSKTKH
jgi:hypothetical protein